MSHVLTQRSCTAALPATSPTAPVRRRRTRLDASSDIDDTAPEAGPWRQRIDRHRRRLVAARAALPSLRDRSAADRALTQVGPVGAAAHWFR